jgi:hypothetical protein
MKSRASRLLGHNVKLQDGAIGRVIGHASQERRLMLKLSMEDSTVRWVHACDTTSAVDEPAPPKAKGRTKTPRSDLVG